MKKIVHIGLLAICLLQFTLKADSWRVLFYMDSSDNLSDMAFKNITDMMCGHLGENVEYFIQLHAYSDSALRYRLQDNAIQFLEEVRLSGDSQQDLIDAAAWGFDDNNADHTMLILSNHGWGILDPRWNESLHKWTVEGDIIQRSHTAVHHQKHHRGFMFNEQSHTYLTNEDLIAGLDTIKNQILYGNNIDILAFDTCMGAMIEVGYQVAPFVNIMVGCQSCALNDGFEYKGIMQALKSEYNDPMHVAQGMINSFDTYYDTHDANGIYTNSAFDLSYSNEVRMAMDNVIALLLNMPNALDILHNARQDTPRLCMWPMYTDMIAFFLNCAHYVQDNSDFTDALEQLLKAHSQMIIAYCAGSDVSNAVHGSAIYCPFMHIERSYRNTVFAQSSLWMNVLELICPEDGSAITQEWTV
jgi:hypothetical protein